MNGTLTEKIIFFIMIVAAIVFGWFAFVEEVSAQENNLNNQVMKACLELHGYTPEEFDNFNFSKAAACHSDWRVGENAEEYAELREFLKKKPWYKGTNWKWEEKAEYTCRTLHHAGGIQVCTKPYYIN